MFSIHQQLPCHHWVHHPRQLSMGHIKLKCRPLAASQQQAASAFNLEAIADSFDAELYGYAGESRSYGIRGLLSSTAVEDSPVIAVPDSSCLMVPWSNTTPQYRAAIHEMYAQHMPPLLVQFLEGNSDLLPELQGPVYNCALHAAWLLWLSRTAGGVHDGSPLTYAWQQYIVQVLPGLHDVHCLLTLSQNEIVQLPSKALQEEASKQLSWAKSVHKVLLGPTGTLRLANTLEETQWALSVVRSRTFDLNLPGPGYSVSVFPPLIDLVNHAPMPVGPPSLSVLLGQTKDPAQQPARPEWARPFATTREIINSSSKAAAPQEAPLLTVPPTANSWVLLAEDRNRLEVLLVPRRPISEGEEVLIDYGPRDVIDSLADYGFVM